MGRERTGGGGRLSSNTGNLSPMEAGDRARSYLFDNLKKNVMKANLLSNAIPLILLLYRRVEV